MREEQERRPACDSPLTAAKPRSGGIAPGAPPITMFCGVAGFSHRVYTSA